MDAATNQPAVGPGEERVSSAPAADPPALAVLRGDHVLLYSAIPGLPMLTDGVKRPGWLVLTNQGEFRFYDKKVPALTEAPALSAAAADEFVRKVGWMGVRVRFGKARFIIWFTGEPAPERRSARVQETTGQGAELINDAGPVIGVAAAALGQALSVVGTLVSLVVDTLQVYRMTVNRKRRAAARTAWYPVLTGARPWHLINGPAQAPPDANEADVGAPRPDAAARPDEAAADRLSHSGLLPDRHDDSVVPDGS